VSDVATDLAMAVPHWTRERWDRFLSLEPNEQVLEAQMLADSAEGPTRSEWETALQILEVAATVAGCVTGITGAISGIQSVVKG